MKFLMSLLAALSISSVASAQHAETDFVAGDLLTHSEIMAYLNHVGWDQVHYAQNTGIGMMFVKATQAGTGKDVILYYWKAYRGATDSNGNLDASKLDQSVASGSANPSPAIDANQNLIMDLNVINPGAQNQLAKMVGFRGMVYDGPSATDGAIFQMAPDGKGGAVGGVSPKYRMALRWMTRKNSTERVILVDSPGVTGRHLLSQHYPAVNYSPSLQNAVIPTVNH